MSASCAENQLLFGLKVGNEYSLLLDDAIILRKLPCILHILKSFLFQN